MDTPENDPDEKGIEKLATGEERRALDDPNLPDDAKAEIAERLERARDFDLEELKGD